MYYQWCNEHNVYKNLFSWLTNNNTTKRDSEINVLNKNFHQYKNYGIRSSTTVRNGLDSSHKNLALVPIEISKTNVGLICKRVYATVITNELVLFSKDKTSTYK